MEDCEKAEQNAKELLKYLEDVSAQYTDYNDKDDRELARQGLYSALKHFIDYE